MTEEEKKIKEDFWVILNSLLVDAIQTNIMLVDNYIIKAHDSNTKLIKRLDELQNKYQKEMHNHDTQNK